MAIICSVGGLVGQFAWILHMLHYVHKKVSQVFFTINSEVVKKFPSNLAHSIVD